MSDAGCFAVNASRLGGLAGALLGWRPAEFWGATPAELGCILDVLGGDRAAPPAPLDLAALMQRFPDDLQTRR